MILERENQKIIFPENTPEIIKEILKKYNLAETADDIFKKWKEGKKSNTQKLAAIVAETAGRKISLKFLASLIESELGISQEIAQKMAEDLQEKLLSLTETVEMKITPERESLLPKEEILAKEEKEVKTEKITKERSQFDIYREPIE